MCEENVSALNGIAFGLLLMSSIACILSCAAPFWVYYPTRYGVPEIGDYFDVVYPEYPFKQASWRGLWAVCFKEADIYGGSHQQMPKCRWFWENNASAWKTIPDWYLAAEVMFGVALALLVLALFIESLHACCHCCLRRSCAPTFVASLTIAGALMCVTSVALFGGYSLYEGEITPEPSGQSGRLDWAYWVGVGGASVAMWAAILFYVDGCRVARIYSNYKQPPSVSGR